MLPELMIGGLSLGGIVLCLIAEAWIANLPSIDRDDFSRRAWPVPWSIRRRARRTLESLAERTNLVLWPAR